MKAKVRCVCGREHWIDIDDPEDKPLCKCGASLRVDHVDHGNIQPFVTTPDGYKFENRKYNRPDVVRWQK